MRLKIGDVLHHHQARRRPAEVKRQSMKADDVERLFLVIVLNTRRDQHVFAVEAVSRRRDDVFLGLPNASMPLVEHFDRLRENLIAIAAAIDTTIDALAAGLEPSLRVEDRPAAAGQRSPSEADLRQPIVGHDKLDSVGRRVVQRFGLGRMHRRCARGGPRNRGGENKCRPQKAQ